MLIVESSTMHTTVSAVVERALKCGGRMALGDAHVMQLRLCAVVVVEKSRRRRSIESCMHCTVSHSLLKNQPIKLDIVRKIIIITNRFLSANPYP